MKPKEFKEEMRMLVANAEVILEQTWRGRTEKLYRSTVGDRTYRWQDMPPEAFAKEQIKRFSQNSRQISRTSFKVDEARIKEHQDMLVWLWNNKNKWSDFFNLRDKYEKHREAIEDYKYRLLWKRFSTDWNDPELKKVKKIIDKMKIETKHLTGFEMDIFNLCDTIPYNWLALA